MAPTCFCVTRCCAHRPPAAARLPRACPRAALPAARLPALPAARLLAALSLAALSLAALLLAALLPAVPLSAARRIRRSAALRRSRAGNERRRSVRFEPRAARPVAGFRLSGLRRWSLAAWTTAARGSHDTAAYRSVAPRSISPARSTSAARDPLAELRVGAPSRRRCRSRAREPRLPRCAEHPRSWPESATSAAIADRDHRRREHHPALRWRHVLRPALAPAHPPYLVACAPDALVGSHHAQRASVRRRSGGPSSSRPPTPCWIEPCFSFAVHCCEMPEANARPQQLARD